MHTLSLIFLAPAFHTFPHRQSGGLDISWRVRVSVFRLSRYFLARSLYSSRRLLYISILSTLLQIMGTLSPGKEGIDQYSLTCMHKREIEPRNVEMGKQVTF